MTVRKTAGLLPLLIALAWIQPLTAQDTETYRWTSSRPDAQGPVSLWGDHTVPVGELQLALKYFHTQMKGQGYGTDSLTLNQVLSLFTVAPDEMVTQGASLDVLYGMTPHLTLLASGTFAKKTMDNLTGVEGQSNVFLFYQTEATGLEDVKVAALYDVYDRGPLRIHVQGGVSVPVGSISSDDVTPFSGNRATQLPYPQQLGSGTFDLLPGFTANIQNAKASLGVQGQGTIRLGENDRGWTLGDVYAGTVWAGYRASEWISVSLGLKYSNWGNVTGFDQDLDPNESPANNTLTQGGWRVDIPMGINVIMPPGRFGGNRLGVDVLAPIHQNLDGPQLRHRWSVAVGWQKTVAF